MRRLNEGFLELLAQQGKSSSLTGEGALQIARHRETDSIDTTVAGIGGFRHGGL